MSTPTEAQYDLRRQVIFSDPDDGAQLIADSEARAVASAVTTLTCTHHTDHQRAACPVCLVTAVATERDQLRALLVYADQILDDIDTCSDAHKPMYSSYSQNVFKLCVKGRDARRAAIDAALKEGAK